MRKKFEVDIECGGAKCKNMKNNKYSLKIRKIKNVSWYNEIIEYLEYLNNVWWLFSVKWSYSEQWNFRCHFFGFLNQNPYWCSRWKNGDFWGMKIYICRINFRHILAICILVSTLRIFPSIFSPLYLRFNLIFHDQILCFQW